jgi:hypothetical protein
LQSDSFVDGGRARVGCTNRYLQATQGFPNPTPHKKIAHKKQNNNFPIYSG